MARLPVHPIDPVRTRGLLGHAFRLLAHPFLAREHYERAMTCYAALGMPEASDLQGILDADGEPP